MGKKNIKRVWCSECINRRPPVIKKAEFLIPARVGYYSLLEDMSGIDTRLVGICGECLAHESDFKRRNTQPVDVDNINLIHRHP